jgi:phosphoglycolate phosphatase
MMRFKVIAFDCDGVMFDTQKANRAYYNDILAFFGRPFMTDEQFRYAQMQTVDKSLEMLFPDKTDYMQAQKYRKVNGYGPYIKHMQMEPDLIAVLEYLRPGCKTAVATNRTDTMKSVLQTHEIESYFDKVVTALDVTHPKPAPDVLLFLLDHFGIRSSEMLYIGDSQVDAAAARSSGVPFAAYGDATLDADYHIRRLMTVKAIVNGRKP